MNPIIWASSLSTNVPTSAATATHTTTHATSLNIPLKLEERVPWFIKNNYLNYRKPQTANVSSSVCSTSLPFGNFSLSSPTSTTTTISGTTITLPAALASVVKLQATAAPNPIVPQAPAAVPQETPASPSQSSSDNDMDESSPMNFDEHELVCAEVLASLKQSAAVEGFFVRRLSVSKASSEDDSDLFSLSKSAKKKVKRNINPCPEHRRKHQRCPPGCNGRRRDSKEFLSSPMEAPITKDADMQDLFSSPQHPQSTTTVTA